MSLITVHARQVSESLRALAGVARVLRRRRAEAGALQLASPEVRFEIDTETHDPLDVGMYQARPALGLRCDAAANARFDILLQDARVCVLSTFAMATSTAPPRTSAPVPDFLFLAWT